MQQLEKLLEELHISLSPEDKLIALENIKENLKDHPARLGQERRMY